MAVLSDALKTSNYEADPMLRTAGVSINSNFTQIEGRVLSAPKLKLGNGEDMIPRNGRWNFRNKKVVQPAKIERWAIVNFSARCDVQKVLRDLARMGKQMGIPVEEPFVVVEESPQDRRAPPVVRVEHMFAQMMGKLPSIPQFLLCLIPERNCNLYWKKKNLAEYGIINQCLAPQRVNDQLIANVLRMINAKLGGLNSLLAVEQSMSIPLVFSPVLFLEWMHLMDHRDTLMYYPFLRWLAQGSGLQSHVTGVAEAVVFKITTATPLASGIQFLFPLFPQGAPVGFLY